MYASQGCFRGNIIVTCGEGKHSKHVIFVVKGFTTFFTCACQALSSASSLGYHSSPWYFSCFMLCQWFLTNLQHVPGISFDTLQYNQRWKWRLWLNYLSFPYYICESPLMLSLVRTHFHQPSLKYAERSICMYTCSHAIQPGSQWLLSPTCLLQQQDVAFLPLLE